MWQTEDRELFTREGRELKIVLADCREQRSDSSINYFSNSSMMGPGVVFFYLPVKHPWAVMCPCVGLSRRASHHNIRQLLFEHRWRCACVCIGRSAFTRFSPPSLHRAWCVWIGNARKKPGTGGAEVLPVLCLVVHVDKDRRVGYGSHGGAVVVRVVGGDQVWAQIRAEHTWGGTRKRLTYRSQAH